MRNRFLCMMATLAIWSLAPALALAEEEHGSDNPVQIDLWQAGFTIVVFAILVAILAKFAFKPILKGLQDREAFIRKSLSDAEEASKKAQQQLADYTAKLDQARSEASAIVDEGRRDAEVLKQKLHEEGEKESAAMIERARREIDIARDTAVRDLYELGGKLATEVAGKIIAKELSPADHERLIQESIGELSGRTASRN